MNCFLQIFCCMYDYLVIVMYKVGMKLNYSCFFLLMIIFFFFQVNVCVFNFGFQDILYEILQQCELVWINLNWLILVFFEGEL